jgi:hypothetical protein
VVAALIVAATVPAANNPSAVCAPTPNPAVQSDWVPFGNATWTGQGLVTTSRLDPSQPYGVTCGGASVYGAALPTTDPHALTALSFDFYPNESGGSAQSPRLDVCFSDGSNCDSNGELYPTQWTAYTWTHVDGFAGRAALGDVWDSVGGKCGSLHDVTLDQVIACHPGATVVQVALVNDSGSLYHSGEEVVLNNLTVNNIVAHAVPPVLGKSATVVSLTGNVMVKTPGAHKFGSVRTIRSLPYGTVVDASNGDIQVIAAKNSTQEESGVFYDGAFHLSQSKSGVVQAQLTGAPKSCPTTPLTLARDAKKKGFSLWGHVKGNYSTKGAYGSASVRGTIWFTENLCNGTFFHVVKGVLFIRDFTLHKSLILHAGHSYLAPNQPPDTFDNDGDANHDKSQGLEHGKR